MAGLDARSIGVGRSAADGASVFATPTKAARSTSRIAVAIFQERIGDRIGGDLELTPPRRSSRPFRCHGRRFRRLAVATIAAGGLAAAAYFLRRRLRRGADPRATRESLRALLAKNRAPVASPNPRSRPASWMEGSSVWEDGELLYESLSIEVEAGERCTLLLCRSSAFDRRKLHPCLVLHGTGGSAHREERRIRKLAALGVLAVGVDLRHHGERVADGTDPNPYWRALKAAWRRPAAVEGAELSHHTAAAAAAHLYPFLYDSVYDCSRVLDYLETRADADCCRVGAFGNSLGGMIIPLLAAADSRLTACAPCIGVQGFCVRARPRVLARARRLAAAALRRRRRRPRRAARRRRGARRVGEARPRPPRHVRRAAIAPPPASTPTCSSSTRPPTRAARGPASRRRSTLRAPRSAAGAPTSGASASTGTSVAAAPLPAAEWKAGHVITDAMFEQVERFLSDRLTEPAPDP